jgi:hypothetical protein
MARAFTVFCCFIVGLQLLIGVPVAVCILFFALFGGLGPIVIEIHPAPGHSPHMFVNSATIVPPSFPLTISPPPNIIPPVTTGHSDSAILETRAQQGSPLSGTILSENESPDIEHHQFVAALQKVAAEAAHESPPPTLNPPTNLATCAALPGNCCETTSATQQADQLVIQHLYEMADIDERTGNFDRADQWRSLAREIRQPSKESTADNPLGEITSSANAEPPPFDLP